MPTLRQRCSTGWPAACWRGLSSPVVWRRVGAVILVNCLVGLLLMAFGASRELIPTLKACNAVGFSIWGAFEALRFATRGRIPAVGLAPLALPAGFVIGSKLAALLGTTDFVALAVQDPAHQWRVLAGSLLIAAFATGFFIFYWRAESYRVDLQAEQRRAAEARQSETQARLALLQAQIEPHFLFNTLANAQSVLESDPKTARSILEHLDRYLRVSLGRTRRASSTLGDELSLVGELLAIAALRLGDRLTYSICVSEELKAARLAPLLLQPLVENALKHGIEPAVRGGEIRIEAERQADSLLLRVIDSGVGLDASSPEGIGLANVRARLSSLYGAAGRLALYHNEPQGVVAELTMPLAGVRE